MSENVDSSQDGAAAPLDWAALLARWMDFARAAVALPEDPEGDRWRASVSPIITLQAVTMALGELHLIAPADRPVAMDRASFLIDRESESLEATWSSDPPGEVQRLVADARATLDAAKSVQKSSDGWA